MYHSGVIPNTISICTLNNDVLFVTISGSFSVALNVRVIAILIAINNSIHFSQLFDKYLLYYKLCNIFS